VEVVFVVGQQQAERLGDFVGRELRASASASISNMTSARTRNGQTSPRLNHSRYSRRRLAVSSNKRAP
jgi:hypothetical protein